MQQALFLPLLIIAAIVVIDSPGASPIYVQERVGKNGRKFKFYKFRSMIPDCEGKGKWNVGNKDDRITKMGHFLRKSNEG